MGCKSTKLIQAWLARLMASAGGTDKDGYRGNGAFQAPFLYRITRWLGFYQLFFSCFPADRTSLLNIASFITLHSVLAEMFILCNSTSCGNSG